MPEQRPWSRGVESDNPYQDFNEWEAWLYEQWDERLPEDSHSGNPSDQLDSTAKAYLYGIMCGLADGKSAATAKEVGGMKYMCNSCGRIWARADDASQCHPNIIDLSDDQITDCPECKGDQYIDGKLCDRCSGGGWILKRELTREEAARADP